MAAHGNPEERLSPRSPWRWTFAAGCLLFGLLVLLRIKDRNSSRAPASVGPNSPRPASAATPSTESRDRLLARLPQRRAASEPAPTAEQIVASKVSQFARNRRALARAMAERFKVE